MLLIDHSGRRRRSICRACKKLHGTKDCPKRRSGELQEQRQFLADALAVQEWLKERRNA